MVTPPGISHRGLLLAVVLLGVGVAFAAWMIQSNNHRALSDQTTTVQTPFPVPAYSESRFLNTGPEAQFIGSSACAICHENNHNSYLRTPHSKALSDLVPEAEPPDGSFDHKASGRSYRVYRKDGQLHHEEVLRTENGQEIARVDLPVRYLIGSGHFSRSYIVEVEGFLHESPITWYAAKQKWDISPGYDAPKYWSFERPVGLACLACHAGRAEEVDGAYHRLKFQEKAIGCENCHGPGSLHQDLHRTRRLAPGEPDLTIVHPGKLSRSLQESICAACHLGSTGMVAVRGREPYEFRPGRPLSDYRIRYQLEGGSDRMTVVGHVEQLRQSACYQKSPGLTCVSCHDPHEAEALKDKSAFYREKCLSCHTSQPCKLEVSQRLQKEKDNCVTCHMPSGDTDIPHLAFTHHRIGHHNTKPTKKSGRVPELVTTDDISHLDPLDQQRNLGLAYLGLSRNTDYSEFARDFRGRATELLEAVSKAGLPDPETALGLVELYSDTDPSRAMLFAKQILEQNASSNVRTVTLKFLSNYYYQTRNYPQAIQSLEELVRLRRISEDWRLLGMCYLKLNELERVLPTFQHALTIRPYNNMIHSGLAELYGRLGISKKADECLEKARWLRLHHQD